jgi:surfeit locus 1 family protein
MPARRFRPSLIALLAMLVVVAVCLRLAFWQLERAEVKARWQVEQAERSLDMPRSLDQLLTMEQPGNFPVVVRGRIDNRHAILLDNRVLNRVAGYHLLSPLETDSGRWVLINRGWLPRGPDRNLLPDIPMIEGVVEVQGYTYQYSDRTFTLADDDLSRPDWPLRLQKVEIDALAAVLGVELAPFEIRVDPDFVLETSDQLPRVWHDPVMGPERHRGYAFQWFAMALATLVFFLAASFRRLPTTEQDQ